MRAVARGQEAMAPAYAKGDEDRSAEDAVKSYVGALLDVAEAGLRGDCKLLVALA